MGLPTGGLLLHNSYAYVGHYAERVVREFNADTFFFSSRGLSDDGRITDTSSDETHLRRAMFEQSRRHILLCDSSKFRVTYCYNLRSLRQVDEMISDRAFGEIRQKYIELKLVLCSYLVIILIFFHHYANMWHPCNIKEKVYTDYVFIFTCIV